MRSFKNQGGAAATNQAASSSGQANGTNPQNFTPQVKLPRTGIEQAFTADRPRFIDAHREFERVANVNVSNLIISQKIQILPPIFILF